MRRPRRLARCCGFLVGSLAGAVISFPSLWWVCRFGCCRRFASPDPSTSLHWPAIASAAAWVLSASVGAVEHGAYLCLCLISLSLISPSLSLCLCVSLFAFPDPSTSLHWPAITSAAAWVLSASVGGVEQGAYLCLCLISVSVSVSVSLSLSLSSICLCLCVCVSLFAFPDPGTSMHMPAIASASA